MAQSSRIDVDLYSDTVTRPTADMRRFMSEAEVGDEQKLEDPTVNLLCEMVAELRGKDAAAAVEAAVRPPFRHFPRSRLVWVEQTSNLGGGSVWPLARVHEVTAVARRHGLSTHLDGARLMNAVVASGVSARDFAAPFDSAWIDFTKGLGAPVGAAMAGSRAFIDEAWRCKQQMGGA